MWQVNHSESFNRVVLVQHDNLTFELQVHIDMRLALDAADAGNTSSGFPLSQVKVSCATSSATVMAVRAVSDSFPQGTVMANEQPQVNTVPVSAVADPVRSLAPNGAPVVQVAPTAPVAPNAIPAVVPVSVGMPATPKAGNTSALPTGSVVSAAPAALMTSATASVSASVTAMSSAQTTQPATTAFMAPYASATPFTPPMQSATPSAAHAYTSSDKPFVYVPSRPANLQEVVDAIYALDRVRFAHLFTNPRVDIVATAKKFFNHYERKGWKIGQSPMSNWLCALRLAIASGYTVDRKRRGWAISYCSVSASAFQAHS